MNSSEDLQERIEMALGALEKKPRPLVPFLLHDYPGVQPVGQSDLEAMLDLLVAEDPNEPLSRRFGEILRNWDNLKEPSWADQTVPNSVERRGRIRELLQLDEKFAARVDSAIPRYALEDPIVIAREHEPWYSPEESGRNFYWKAYSNYLKTTRHWPEDSVTNLGNATTEIVARLANPEARDAFGSRGLVVGYVQSGKTANFTGVVAKAADAGYRLIIVLGGDMEHVAQSDTKEDRQGVDWSRITRH